MLKLLELGMFGTGSHFPTHGFTTWLALLDRLKTKNKLFQYGIGDNNLCAIYSGAPETSAHLFFECSYIKECFTVVLDWLGVMMRRYFFIQVLHWFRTYCRNSFKQKVFYAVIARVLYQVWKARNSVIWDRLFLQWIPLWKASSLISST